MKRAIFALLVLATLPLSAAPVPSPAAAPALTLPDLDNHPVNPFLAAESHKAIVFLFASVECPVSNRYAPVVKRLYDTYAAQNVAFWLIYPNPSDSPAAIRDH